MVRLDRLILSLVLLLVSLVGWADGSLSAPSKVLYSRYLHAPARHKMPQNGMERIQAFITINDQSAVQQLQQHGVEVNGVFGGVVSAGIPVASLDEVSGLNCVNGVSLAQPLHFCNDMASQLSHVDWVHEAVGQVVPLKGRGVIVGMIDTGIDYNHINFKDENGQNRIKAVYLPCDYSGTSPVIDGFTLPGSCYETPSQIATLTTDNTLSSHGTHTTGTAAGSYMGNAWSGMAPEADIVACGIPGDSLTDVNVVNSVNYIFDYARRVGKPCVINMSLGTNSGPNDGTSPQCRVFERLSGPGRICVVSAGNDGEYPICFHSLITGPADTVTTLLRRGSGSRHQGYVSMWSNGSQVHRSRLIIINRNTGEQLYASPVMGMLPEDSVYTLSSDDNPAFATFFEGEIQFANAQEPQFSTSGEEIVGYRYNSYWMFDAKALETDYLLGLQYMADEYIDLAGWSTRKTYFYTYGFEGVTGGSNSGSISDLATTDAVISVGAYCSHDTFENWQEGIILYPQCHPGEIASFSSFGPDECGKLRPDVCAPGFVVLSSANRYDEKSSRENWLTPAVVDGIEYPYYANMGTSMSAPVVTGTIALMLQVNKTLTAADVRQVLQATSMRDDFINDDNAPRWGNGKLDAWAAVNHVASQTLLPGDVNDDGEVTVADIMRIVEVIQAGSTRFDAGTMIRADVNKDLEISLSDLNAAIQLIINK